MFQHQLVRGSLCTLSRLVLPVTLCHRLYWPTLQGRLRGAERLVTAPSLGRAALETPPSPAPHSLLRADAHRPHWLAPVSPSGWDRRWRTRPHSQPPSQPQERHRSLWPGFQLGWAAEPWEWRADGELKNSSPTQLDEEPVLGARPGDNVKTTLVFMLCSSIVSGPPPALSPGLTQILANTHGLTSSLEPGFAGTERETEPLAGPWSERAGEEQRASGSMRAPCTEQGQQPHSSLRTL